MAARAEPACDLQYVVRDREIVDYAPYRHEASGLWFRGPDPFPIEDRPYIVCLGASQTFGPLSEHPFPALLQQVLGLPVVNFGCPGAGPAFFHRHADLLAVANGAAAVVVQAMSGRSVDNSLFVSAGLERLTRRTDGEVIGALAAYRGLLRTHRFRNRSGLRDLVAETRANWLADCDLLLSRISAPKVAFWYSTRAPDYTERFLAHRTLTGGFPHFVNRAMWETLAGSTDAAVSCIGRRGLPQRLTNAATGRPVAIDPAAGGRPDLRGGLFETLRGRRNRWTRNRYYPSPEMHQDAARALEPVLRAFL